MLPQMKRRGRCAARHARRFSLLAALWLCFGIDAAGAADQLKIGGTGSALGVTAQLVREFVARQLDVDLRMRPRPADTSREALARQRKVEVEFVPSLGSEGGMRALAAGAINLALASRPMNEDERRQGLVEIEFARTPFVFAVAARSAAGSVTLAELADIYAGRMTRWSDGTPVRVVLRPGGDIDSELIKSVSPAIRSGLEAAANRPGVRFSVTDQDAARDIEAIPGAIGPTTLAIITTEKRELRALKLEGREPTLANAISGAYPYYKRLYFVTRAERPAIIEAFIAFVQSSAGRRILANAGCYIARDRP